MDSVHCPRGKKAPTFSLNLTHLIQTLCYYRHFLWDTKCPSSRSLTVLSGMFHVLSPLSFPSFLFLILRWFRLLVKPSRLCFVWAMSGERKRKIVQILMVKREERFGWRLREKTMSLFFLCLGFCPCFLTALLLFPHVCSRSTVNKTKCKRLLAQDLLTLLWIAHERLRMSENQASLDFFLFISAKWELGTS